MKPNKIFSKPGQNETEHILTNVLRFIFRSWRPKLKCTNILVCHIYYCFSCLYELRHSSLFFLLVLTALLLNISVIILSFGRTNIISAILLDLNLSKKQNLTCPIDINYNKIKKLAVFINVENDSAHGFRIVQIIISCIIKSLFTSCKLMIMLVQLVYKMIFLLKHCYIILLNNENDEKLMSNVYCKLY